MFNRTKEFIGDMISGAFNATVTAIIWLFKAILNIIAWAIVAFIGVIIYGTLTWVIIWFVVSLFNGSSANVIGYFAWMQAFAVFYYVIMGFIRLSVYGVTGK